MSGASSQTVTRFAVAQDLPGWVPYLAVALGAASVALLVVELTRGERGRRLLVALTGALSAAALVLAVLRPVRVAASETAVGPRVVVLADTSRSLALVDDGAPRTAARDRAIEAVRKAASGARVTVLGFGEGPPSTLTAGSATAHRSDLRAALSAVAASADERPAAVVVVSDGRLDDPPEDASDDALRALLPGTHIHTVATTRRVPRDASVRRVSAAGAVAHVALPLTVEVGCAGGLACSELTVIARELRDDGPSRNPD